MGLSGRYVGVMYVGATCVGVTVGVAAGVGEGGGVFIGVRVIVGDVAGVGAEEWTIVGNAVWADIGSGVGMGGSMEMGVTAALGIDAGADIRAGGGGTGAYTGIAVAGISACARERVGCAVGVIVGVGRSVRTPMGTAVAGIGACAGERVGGAGYVGFGRSARYFTPFQTRAITSRLSAADPTADAVTLRLDG